MLDQMQPKGDNQDKEDTKKVQDTDASAAQEKQKSCPTPGLPSSSSCPCVALLFFSFSQLPVKYLVPPYSTDLLYKLAKYPFLVTNNHKDTYVNYTNLGELNHLSLRLNS